MTAGGGDTLTRVLDNVRAALPRLEALLAEADRLSGRESSLVRVTSDIVAELRALAPDHPLNRTFVDAIEALKSDVKSDRWAEGSMPAAAPRPIVNAFLQARFFLHLGVHLAKAHPREESFPQGAQAFLRLYEP